MDKICSSWDHIFTEEVKEKIRMFLYIHLENIPYAPSHSKIFRVFQEVSYHDVKVCILGKAPYPSTSLCNGIPFSVPMNKSLTPTLKEIYSAIKEELQISLTHGDLSEWLSQGILLLNCSMTIGLGDYSCIHHHEFWSFLIKKVVSSLSRRGGVVFLLWGKEARRFERYIQKSSSVVVCTDFPRDNCKSFRDAKQFKLVKELTNSVVDFHI